MIWGAGSTGRQLHDLLLAEGRAVAGFIDVHPRRIGGQKRGRPVWGIDDPGQWLEAFILAAVGSRGARPEIAACLQGLGKTEGEDYLHVA